jgi:hypothetical protein
VRDYSNNAIDAWRGCVLLMSLTFRAPTNTVEARLKVVNIHAGAVIFKCLQGLHVELRGPVLCIVVIPFE